MKVDEEFIREMFAWVWQKRNPAMSPPSIPINQMRDYLAAAIHVTPARQSARPEQWIERVLNHLLWIVIVTILVGVVIGAIGPTSTSWAGLIFLTFIGGIGWLGTRMGDKANAGKEDDDDGQ